MPIDFAEDPQAEADAIRQEQAQRARVNQYRTTATAQQAQALSQLVSAYPHLTPGTAVPLALSGADPNDPATVGIATQAAKTGKKKHGHWWNPIDIVSTPFALAADVLSDATGAATDYALKPIVRWGSAALAAPLEEGVGALRAVAASAGDIAAGVASGAATGAGLGAATFTPWGVAAGLVGGAVVGGVGGALAEKNGVKVEGEGWRPQSTLLTSLMGGPGLGSGYLPGHAATEAAAERARQTGKIGNHAFTPGRFFAAAAFDEDTAPYKLLSGLVDASNAWNLDPAQHGLKAAGEARKAAKSFDGLSGAQRALAEERLAAGLVDGAHRPSLIRENVTTWLDSSKGSRVLDKIAQTDDYEALRKALPDVAHDTILDLKDATSAGSVRQILEGRLGIERGLEVKPNITTRGITVQRTKDQFRMLGWMPREGINWSKPDEAIEQFGRLQQNIKMPYEQISRNNEALSRALREGNIDKANGIFARDFVGHSEGLLAKAGYAPDLAKQMGRIWEKIPTQIRTDLMADVVDGTRVGVVNLGGVPTQISSPGMMLDVLDNLVDFSPDVMREIRRNTSRFKPLVTNPAWMFTSGVAEQLTSKAWKLTTLIRGAYATRNVAEAQLRMAAVGHDSFFRHPLDYMAWMAADDGKVGQILKKFGVKSGRGDVDMLGRAWTENQVDIERALRGEMNGYAQSINRDARREGWLEGSMVKSKTQTMWNKEDPFYTEALATQLERLHSEPIVRHMADPARDAVRTSPSYPWNPQRLMEDPDLGPVVQDFAKLKGARQLSTEGGRIPDSASVRQWLDGYLNNAKHLTGEDRRLWDVLHSGEINGQKFRLADGTSNPAFKNELESLVRAGAGPDQVRGALVKSTQFGETWNRAVGFMFDLIDTKPTAKLVSSPLHRQNYWQEATRLISEAEPAAKADILKWAEEAQLPKNMMEKLRLRAAASSGDLNADSLHLLADVRAKDLTQKLLYQAVDKGQLSDVLRIVFPFMEAQTNSLARWSRLGIENPQALRRVPQVMNAARGNGTFYQDPTTGDEMFVYPGSRFLTSKIFGMPIPLTGSVKGLNMFGSGLMPGAGPVAQISTRWLLPDKPRYDQIRQMVDPFGDSAQGGILEQFGPAWLKKMITGKAADPDGDKKFGEAVFSIYQSGVSSGRYDPNTSEGIAHAMEDAKQKARWLFVLQGAATLGGSPTNPAPEFVAQDKDGTWHMIDALAQEYQKLQADPKIPDAGEAFMDKFGPNVFTIMQPKTSTQGAVLSDASTAAGKWVRDNASVVGDYKAVYGVFAPSDPSSDFDSQTWARQIRQKERWPLDPLQRVKLGNDKMAKTIYYNAADKFGPFPTQVQQNALRQLNDALKVEYPGYREQIGLPEKIDLDTKISEVVRAAADPRLSDNPAMEPIKLYLSARDKLIEVARSRGLADVRKGKKAADLRSVLRQLGAAMVAEMPAFTPAWERIFSGEVSIDEPQEATVGA